jgi:hypothetical protein
MTGTKRASHPRALIHDRYVQRPAFLLYISIIRSHGFTTRYHAHTDNCPSLLVPSRATTATKACPKEAPADTTGVRSRMNPNWKQVLSMTRNSRSRRDDKHRTVGLVLLSPLRWTRRNGNEQDEWPHRLMHRVGHIVISCTRPDPFVVTLADIEKTPKAAQLGKPQDIIPIGSDAGVSFMTPQWSPLDALASRLRLILPSNASRACPRSPFVS